MPRLTKKQKEEQEAQQKEIAYNKLLDDYVKGEISLYAFQKDLFPYGDDSYKIQRQLIIMQKRILDESKKQTKILEEIKSHTYPIN